jgi:penicillin-binding protein 1A
LAQGKSRKKQPAKSAKTAKTAKSKSAAKQQGRKWWQYGLLASLWALLGGLAVLAWFALTLPDVDAILARKQPPITTILAADGSTLSTLGGGYDEWLAHDEMPQVLIDAVLATEDRRFYDHGGLDYIGVARALWANVTAGGVVQGGSTLTQQLAKNLFLTPERTISRKIREALLALSLEDRFTKEEILEQYLNRVYLGSGAYGIEAAAKRYFNHSARTLSTGEAALLAGLLKAPSRYSPLSNKELSFQRMRVVLAAMQVHGVLSSSAVAQVSAPIIVSHRGQDSKGYFTDWIMAALPVYVDQTAGDLVVQTTFDPKAQAQAEAALNNALDQWGQAHDMSQGAIVVMGDDGAVKAMKGGRSYRGSEYNRATTALRQPGSAFKLFVYLTAFEQGRKPSQTMRDTPIVLDGWQPKNYDGKHAGTLSLRKAFATSNNIIAVKLAEQSNRAEVIRTAQRLGITTPIIEQPSMALGASEVHLMDLTAAYAVIANGGEQVQPFGIMSVTTRDGAVVYRHRETPFRILEKRPLKHIQDVLAHTVASGTGRAARLPGRRVGGKTGTSQESRDAWFVGYSGDLVAGVWVGNDDASPMKNVTGGFVPAIIWRQTMDGLR